MSIGRWEIPDTGPYGSREKMVDFASNFTKIQKIVNGDVIGPCKIFAKISKKMIFSEISDDVNNDVGIS